MAVDIPIAVLALLVHLGICLSSLQPDRLLRLVAGLMVIALAIPLRLFILPLPVDASLVSAVLAVLQERSSLYLPFFSFLVYIRSSKAPAQQHQ